MGVTMVAVNQRLIQSNVSTRTETNTFLRKKPIFVQLNRFMKTYDAIVIGSGQGGTPLSKKLEELGWKVILIEKKAIGGTCINEGCTPTKTMIASAKMAYDITKADQFGIQTGATRLDIKKVLLRKNSIVEDFRSSAEKGLKETKDLDIIYGTASFTGKKEVMVVSAKGRSQKFTADKIFINAGTRPNIVSIKGLVEVDYLTSTTIMELPEVPDHLLILGGGYIGLEFGQMYRRFGSKVTIVESNARFLPHEDDDVAKCIREFLEKEGIQIMTGAEATAVTKQAGGIAATVKTSSTKKRIACSHLLMALGRIPNSDLLNLEAAGLKTDPQGFIKVNGQLETNVKGIYALGDIKGGPQFTHVSYNDHLLIYKTLTGNKKVNYLDRLVPYTMFTDPQLGRVGITEDEARKKKMKIQIATLDMSHVARAIETGDTRGMMKALVNADNGKILGAAIIGEQGGEIMTMLQMAMIGGIKWQQIRELPIAHPLYAESLNNLFMKLT